MSRTTGGVAALLVESSGRGRRGFNADTGEEAKGVLLGTVNQGLKHDITKRAR